MECEEPAASLVHTLGNEVSGEYVAGFESVGIFKRIVDLSVRHGAGVEPHVDKVGFALHRFAGWRYQHDVVDVRTVQVNTVVVVGRVVTWHKAFIAQWVRGHYACFYSLVDFVVEVFY